MASADFSPPWETSLGKIRDCAMAFAEFTRPRVRMVIGHPHPMLSYPTGLALVFGFCPSNPSLAVGFLQTPPHGDALASC